eukprot:8912557-Pyramimonas_sp.AAC.1
MAGREDASAGLRSRRSSVTRKRQPLRGSFGGPDGPSNRAEPGHTAQWPRGYRRSLWLHEQLWPYAIAGRLRRSCRTGSLRGWRSCSDG